MNAMKEFITPIKKNDEMKTKTNISLVNREIDAGKKEADKMAKDYLNEQLYYFYNNGGPAMDL